MGLKDMLFGHGETKELRQIAKSKQKLMNPHRQTDDRMYAANQLLQMRSAEAVEALLDRFTYRTDSSIVDEDEKRSVSDGLVELGELAMGPVEAFVLKRPNVFYPLKIYQEVAGEAAALDLLIRALSSVEDGYGEEERRKTELISNLREFKDPKAEETLLTALMDNNDDVRVMAVEGLVAYGADKALTPLVERILDPQESARIRTVILEVLADTGWSLKKHRAALTGNIPPGYDLSPDGAILRA
jgi:hypothetical protein